VNENVLFLLLLLSPLPPVPIQLFQVNLGALDPMYVNGGANALFTSASQLQSSRSIKEVNVIVLM
jgi:hypothetical protein